jgi:UDP-galactopyranose mutase
MHINIIGCGLTGITAACLLSIKGHAVSIFETRNQIGGNCFDSNISGTLVQNYGPHIFHTNDEEVYSFLNYFSEFIPFKYQPKGNTNLGLISLPYSRKTIQELGRELNEEEVIKYIFKDYSEKQWGVPFEEIPNSIISRIPKVKNELDPTWYGNEKYQCIPKYGYTKMFENMLDGLTVHINCKKNEWRKYEADLTIYTGRVDEYFDYCYGELPYRSLEFEHRMTEYKMPYYVENQNTKKTHYTRVYDHSYTSFYDNITTIITKEYPIIGTRYNTPFYPIQFGLKKDLYAEYKRLVDYQRNVLFLGRLATNKYLDMWVAIRTVMNALKDF